MILTVPYGTSNSEGADKANKMAFQNSLGGSINDYQVLVREHLQNSSDAFNNSDQKGKLVFKISRTKLDFTDADLDGLLELYHDYYNYTSVKEEKTALKQAIDNLSSFQGKYEAIWAIRFEDNSGGLNGVSWQSQGLGSEVIVGENITTKEDHSLSNKGSFGVGKITAFVLLNKTFTVFYYNRNTGNNEDYLLGKVKIPTFYKNGKRFGKNAFIGQQKTDDHGLPYSDWVTPTENQKNYRSIKEAGLTTIIPLFEPQNETETDWCYILGYSVLHSFFKMFENNEGEVIIEDDLSGTNLIINQDNYREVYQLIGEKTFINDPQYLKNKYDYLVTKPFIVHSIDKSYTFNEDIEVKRGYSGQAILNLYENNELEDFLETYKTDLSREDRFYARTVRLVRDGMLLRESKFPSRPLPRINYSGYLEFTSTLNDVVKKGENLRHDDFHLRNIPERSTDNFPSRNTIHQKFFNFINQFIKEKLNVIYRESIQDGKEIDIELKLTGNTLGEQEHSYERVSILKSIEIPTSVKKHNFLGKKGIPADLNEKGEIDDAVVIDLPKFPKPKPKPNPIPNPIPNPDPNPKPIPDEGIDGKKKKGEKSKVLPEAEFYFRLEKILDASNSLKEYSIRIDNYPNRDCNLTITQKGGTRKPVVTFRLIEMEINGNDHEHFFPIISNKKKNIISHYKLERIPITNGPLILKLIVKEPLNTDTNFSIKFLKL